MPPDSLIVSVDRVEGRVVVVEGDDGRIFEIPARELSGRPAEGLVYVVPLDKAGQPVWNQAVADPAETMRRRKELERRMAARRKIDSGGDFSL